MEYTALYRKYRPLTFNEMVGQEKIIKTLKNEIIANRVGHSYLFCGERGTGKTTSAKILARAVNCLNPKDGEPCNECEICKASLDGSLTDIVEMDAASNNGVDNIREIRDEVNFLPTLAKYRVYIIDEVHMLSAGAFNALLKTLEEPPEHVKFILATTEPQKLPATIISRCQRFDFKKIPNADLVNRLKFVAKDNALEITDEALYTIADLAEGAARDALSILERCSQENVKITQDVVKELAGVAKLTYVNKLSKCIFEKNVEEALKVIDNLANEGTNLNNFIWELIKYIKDILVRKSNGELKVYNEEELKQIDELKELVMKERLLKIIYNLSELAKEMKWASQKNILFQVGIIKECTASDIVEDKSITSNANHSNSGNVISSEKYLELAKQLDSLKTEMNNLKDNAYNNMTGNIEGQKGSKEQVKKDEKPKKIIHVEPGAKLDIWPNIMKTIKDNGKMSVYSQLIDSSAVALNDVSVGIKVNSELAKSIIELPENTNMLEKEISINMGKHMKVKVLGVDTIIKEKTNVNADGLNELQKQLGNNINVIDS